MKNKFSFKIESLLYGVENPKGAIAQVLFAKKVAEHEGMLSFNRLARLEFSEPKINRALPGAVPLDETLLIGHESWNDVVLHLCMRSGQSTCKIATGYFPNREVSLHNDYGNAFFQKKLTIDQISEIFNYVWDNLEIIQPHLKPLKD